MKGEIENRVARSGLVQLDMADFFPKDEIIEYDIAQNLWQGIALKEKDFRRAVLNCDWTGYSEKHLALFCSVDAVIPSWAYMLLASALQDNALSIHVGNAVEVEQKLLLKEIQKLNPSNYMDARVVIKGCSDKQVSPAAWVAMTNLLKPVVKSLMFGEPCSTVPVYKKTVSTQRKH